MVFNQQNWNVQGDVINAAGDVILTKDSSRGDLAKALADLRAELAKLDGLSDEDRRELEQEAETAAADAQRPDVPKEQVAGRLERLRQRLGELDGVAGGALMLAQTVGGIAAWVAAL